MERPEIAVPVTLFEKVAWDCSLKPIWGCFDWPGANRDGANLQHLFLVICYYKTGEQTIKTAKFAAANGPTAIDYPEGPNLEIIQDLSTRLKLSSEIETNRIFKRAWKFQASHPPNPYLCGKFSQGRDWKFQARLKFSREIFACNFQGFKRDCFFQDSGPLGSIMVKPRWGGWAINRKIVQKSRNKILLNLFWRLVIFREVSAYFRELVHIFGALVHIFGELVSIFGKLVHILAWKLVSRTCKQVSRNLGPLWQPGVYNDTEIILKTTPIPNKLSTAGGHYWNGALGRGCDEADISEESTFSLNEGNSFSECRLW